MERGCKIVATRDGKTFTAGTPATLDRLECIDSEDYVFATTAEGLLIGPSYVGYWRKAE